MLVVRLKAQEGHKVYPLFRFIFAKYGIPIFMAKIYNHRPM
jgi:hypothetical protein